MKKTSLSAVFLLSLLVLSCSQKSKPQPQERVTEEFAETSAQADQHKQSADKDTTCINELIHIRKGEDVGITKRSMYTMKAGQEYYPFLSDKPFKATIYYLSGPEATAGAHFLLEYWENDKWIQVPFTDNLAFADVGYKFSLGATLDYVAGSELFKYTLKPGKYRIVTYVTVELFTEFDIADRSSVRTSVRSSNAKAPFELSVTSAALQNKKDSILLTINNHSDMPVFLTMYPQLSMPGCAEKSRVVYHPAIWNMSSTCANVLHKATQTAGGSSLQFCIPAQWDIRQSYPNLNKNERADHNKGHLEYGHYKYRILLGVILSAEFVYGQE